MEKPTIYQPDWGCGSGDDSGNDEDDVEEGDSKSPPLLLLFPLSVVSAAVTVATLLEVS